MERQKSFDTFCPVCYEIPSAEIFQCKHAHTICHNCVKNISLCPQCREPFEEDIGRCMDLENILNGQKFECYNKGLGCEGTFLRQDLPAHSARCIFRETSARICRSLGYNCEYVVYSTKLAAALLHFEAEHNIICQNHTSGKILLECFSENPLNKSTMWSPVIFQDRAANSLNPETFLVAAKINGGNQTISLIGILLSGHGKSAANDFSIQFTLKAESDEIESLQWTNPFISLAQAEAVFNLPYLQIPGSLLSTFFTSENGLEVHVCITSNKRTTKADGVEMETVPVVSCCFVDCTDAVSNPAPLAVLVESTSENYVNFGVNCDTCGAENFEGTRHSCLQCYDFDICDACKKLGKHSQHLLVSVRGWSENVALRKLKLDQITYNWKPLLSADIIVENSALCSECKKNAERNDFLGVCLNCSSFYGICMSCMTNEKMRAICRNHKWNFQRIG